MRQDTAGYPFEVIVVDDGSKTPLLDSFATSCMQVPDWLIVHRTENRGRSMARNEGAQLAKGEILLFIDDDILLPPDFIKQHACLHDNQSEPCFVHGRIYDLLELTPFMDPESGKRFPYLKGQPARLDLTRGLLSYDKVFGNWKRFAERNRRLARLEKLIASTLADESLTSCHWIGCVGGNMSVGMKLFHRVGGYDPMFRVWGGEDFELGYRLVNDGARAVYAEEASVYHMTHAHEAAEDQLLESRNYFMNKHSDPCIHYLYEFLGRKLKEEEVILLWRKAIQHGKDPSTTCS